MLGPMASFASGNTRFTASASTWEVVWRSAANPSGSLAVQISSRQSCSTMVRRSTTSPSTLAQQAALARPSLMSMAMSYTLLLSSYSFTEPSFKIIFMFSPSIN